MSAAAKTMTARSVRTPTSPAAPLSTPPPPKPPPEHTVHWFRKGLRLHDNPSLRESLVNAATFRCVFVIDPWFASTYNVGINKWRFLLQCLSDLDDSLRKLGSRLFVIRGQPADALPKLFKEWGTTLLSFEEDPEPYGRIRDHNIMMKCREVGIKCVSRVSHTLYKLDKIIERNGGKAPLTYHQFQALIASMPAPPRAEPSITAETLNGAITPVYGDHDDRFGVPTLEELGFDTDNVPPPVWYGGETEALARLERHLERKAWVASFGRPKMTPHSLLASQTGLSPYLRFGCLSTRLFYYQLTELYERIKRVRPPLSLHGQILWREFFYCAATKNPNFDRMEGNPICVQIPWDKNNIALTKWAIGQTGFPWIDAIMIQLREEGWIHHLARHAVACFLTRGDLWISWEEGMKVFDELLLDADWSVNAGTWMWLSCSSFFQQFFHCYCPVRFGRKTDPNGDYIRRYIPVLRNMPTRYIHEPWVAPESIQKAAKCVVGRDYPVPIVDHAHVSEINIERIKLVYAQLSQYRPQGSLNPIAVQRPSVTQSSPSPTSIINSINQSNYLCSQSADPRTSSPLIPYKDSEIFQRPVCYEAAHRVRRLAKYKKEIVIVHKVEETAIEVGSIVAKPKKFTNNKLNASYKLRNLATPRTRSTNSSLNKSYKLHQSHSSMPAQENYEFSNLAINNLVETYASQNVYHQVLSSQPDPQLEYQQQALKINKFHMPLNRVNQQYYTPSLFVSSPDILSDCDIKNENTNIRTRVLSESTSEDGDSTNEDENEQNKQPKR